MGINYGSLAREIKNMQVKTNTSVNQSKDRRVFNSNVTYVGSSFAQKIFDYISGKSNQNITIADVLNGYNQINRNGKGTILCNNGDSGDFILNVKFKEERYYGGYIFDWEVIKQAGNSLDRNVRDIDSYQLVHSVISNNKIENEVGNIKVVNYSTKLLSKYMNINRINEVNKVFSDGIFKIYNDYLGNDTVEVSKSR